MPSGSDVVAHNCGDIPSAGVSKQHIGFKTAQGLRTVNGRLPSTRLVGLLSTIDCGSAAKQARALGWPCCFQSSSKAVADRPPTTACRAAEVLSGADWRRSRGGTPAASLSRRRTASLVSLGYGETLTSAIINSKCPNSRNLADGKVTFRRKDYAHGDLLPGSLLRRTIRHKSGCYQCDRGEDPPVLVLVFSERRDKVRHISLFGGRFLAMETRDSNRSPAHISRTVS
jgi:hypothetical protein